jgi:phosphoserine aminotransferase
MITMQPTVKPKNPNFSSGPCSKRPGYDVAKLQLDTLGRSHRSALGKKSSGPGLHRDSTHVWVCLKVTGLPWCQALDTGAVEMAMWSLLGQRGVDVLAWESFGSGWVTDIVKQLKLPNVTKLEAGYGDITDFSKVNFENDVVFTWNGTTSGVKVPDGDWIPADRAGLTICDATSAVFAMELPLEKLDVITYSWQKVLGGEGRARHADPEPARRAAAGELHPAVAYAQAVSHDLGRQADRRAVQG